MAAFILTGIYPSHTHTYTYLYSCLERPSWLALQLGFEEQVKSLILKLKQSKKDFKLKNYCPKRPVSGLCWNSVCEI